MSAYFSGTDGRTVCDQVCLHLASLHLKGKHQSLGPLLLVGLASAMAAPGDVGLQIALLH